MKLVAVLVAEVTAADFDRQKPLALQEQVGVQAVARHDQHQRLTPVRAELLLHVAEQGGADAAAAVAGVNGEVDNVEFAEGQVVNDETSDHAVGAFQDHTNAVV